MLLLNLYLAGNLDEVFKVRCPELPLLRWVDDGLIPCRTPEEGHDTLNLLHQIIQEANLELKQSPPPTLSDLNSIAAEVEWLGYRIRKGACAGENKYLVGSAFRSQGSRISRAFGPSGMMRSRSR